jgi:glycosyltransferase involved in cell wall biosynthesis
MTRVPTVVQLVNSLQWGGVRRHVLDLQAGMRDNGVRSIIAAWLPADDTLRSDSDIHALPLYDRSGRMKSAAGLLRSIRLLRELLRRESVQLLHMHSRYATLLGSLAARGSGVVRLYTAHNTFEDLRRLPWYPRDVIAPSTAAREQFLESVGRRRAFRVRVIRHGVEIPRNPSGIASEETRFCFVGRLCEEKGVRVLAEALRLLKLRDGRVPSIDIIGDGPLAPWFRQYVASNLSGENIRLHGHSTDVRGLVVGATASLFPSIRLESIGYVNLEAMSVGVPVIASDLAVIRDLVIQRETGMRVPPGDAHALAAAMREALDDPAGMRRMGVNARTLVQERHSIEGMCTETAEMYRELLLESPS